MVMEGRGAGVMEGGGMPWDMCWASNLDISRVVHRSCVSTNTLD